MNLGWSSLLGNVGPHVSVSSKEDAPPSSAVCSDEPRAFAEPLWMNLGWSSLLGNVGPHVSVSSKEDAPPSSAVCSDEPRASSSGIRRPLRERLSPNKPAQSLDEAGCDSEQAGIFEAGSASIAVESLVGGALHTERSSVQSSPTATAPRDIWSPDTASFANSCAQSSVSAHASVCPPQQAIISEDAWASVTPQSLVAAALLAGSSSVHSSRATSEARDALSSAQASACQPYGVPLGTKACAEQLSCHADSWASLC